MGELVAFKAYQFLVTAVKIGEELGYPRRKQALSL
jgi:hypothetical protein